MISYILMFLIPSGVFSQAPASFDSNPPFAAEVAVPVNSQYHTQDTSGQYSYSYANGESSKEESRSLDGVTRGSYSYIDANGVLQSVSYEADAEHGFRVAATNLPLATSLQYNPQPNNEVILVKKIQSAAGNLNELPAREIAENIQANDTKGKYTSRKDAQNETEQTIVPKSDKNDISSLDSITFLPPKILHQNINEKKSEENNKVVVNNGDIPLRFIHPLVNINSRYTPLIYSSAFNNELLVVNQLPKYSYNNNDFWNHIKYRPLIGRDNVYRLPSPYMIYDGVEPLLSQESFVPTGLTNIQYHLQNGRGNYLYGYNNQLSAKEEKRGGDGITRGFYSYPDAYGQLQSVTYSADAINGFQSASSTLPHWPVVVPINK